MQTIKTLIHVHTDYSYDSDITLETLLGYAEANDFGCLTVTDHDSIDGGLQLRNMTSMKIIVGEEVSTRDGHLIGLFLQERIRPGMSAMDTAKAIREQGGLVFVPHPFVKAFSCGIGKLAWKMLDLIDAVEINNAQNCFVWPDVVAKRFAHKTGKVAYVGADSHMKTSIAPCHQVMRDFDGPQDFLRALSTAQLFPGRHPLSFFAATGYRIMRHMLGLSLGGHFGENAHPDQVHTVNHPAAAA